MRQGMESQSTEAFAARTCGDEVVEQVDVSNMHSILSRSESNRPEDP